MVGENAIIFFFSSLRGFALYPALPTTTLQVHRPRRPYLSRYNRLRLLYIILRPYATRCPVGETAAANIMASGSKKTASSTLRNICHLLEIACLLRVFSRVHIKNTVFQFGHYRTGTTISSHLVNTHMKHVLGQKSIRG